MARPVSRFGREVRDAIDAVRGGVITWRLIANYLVATRQCLNSAAPAEMALVRRQIEEMVRSGELIAVGPVSGGKGRPLMGYRTAESMQQRAKEHGAQIPSRRARQRAAIEQLVLAFGE